MTAPLASLSPHRLRRYRYKIFFRKAAHFTFTTCRRQDYHDPSLTKILTNLQITAYNQGRKDAQTH